ncbi:hypothetical protein [Deinococcus arcticus]|uniref:Uncharacterized protein n=1 Tax=Deinococcus arcticus TaxID=2136176 RepID=A0A2T3WA06_9DEIO|nr:hypothetical protein [Deinococcus arcticus]PTA68725.1 hypothetical protein C8263_05625 [Deinococcus arcticus]
MTGPVLLRSALRLTLLGLTLLGGAQGRSAAPGPGCPEHWSALNPADLRATRVSVRRAPLTDARGQPGPHSLSQGEAVLQGPAVGGRRCTYVPGDASRSGFLRPGDTEPLPTPTAPENGTWERDANAGLTVTGKPGSLMLTGTGLFATASGGVNVSHLNGPLRRGESARRWVYSDGDCTLTLWPVGPWLLVQDNLKCAGANVTFAGLYRHVR